MLVHLRLGTHQRNERDGDREQQHFTQRQLALPGGVRQPDASERDQQ